MQIKHVSITAVLVLSMFAGMGCKRSVEDRASDATKIVRDMNRDIVEAEKKVITKFKALPEADDIRMMLGKNIDDKVVSEKMLNTVEEAREKELVENQKDYKGESLIGQLHISVKGLNKRTSDGTIEAESFLSVLSKGLESGVMSAPGRPTVKIVTDLDKKQFGYLIELQKFEVETSKEWSRISADAAVKLDALMK